MAYYSQDRKKTIQPRIKSLLKEYGLKGSLSVRNHSTVVLTIREGELDFIRNYNSIIDIPNSHNRNASHQSGYMDVNVYWYKEHFNGKWLEFLEKAIPLLNEDNFDKSDIMTDYFHVGWYVDVNIGKWNKDYKVSRAI